MRPRRRRAQDSTRPSDRIALCSALVGGVLVLTIFGARAIFSGTRAPPTTDVLGVRATAQPPRVQVGAQPSPSPGPPTPSASPAGQ